MNRWSLQNFYSRLNAAAQARRLAISPSTVEGPKMDGWKLSEQDTRELRAESGCPLDACIYARGDLKALVYCDPEPRWHLYLASKDRMPETAELLEAREYLLPVIVDWDFKRDPDHGDYCLHLWELFDWRERLQ